MEDYNWISAKVEDDLGELVDVRVRQCGGFSDKFISEEGRLYDICRLDFTQAPEQNAIADHKAKIGEREYWRKLRGDILLSFLTMNGQENTIDRILEMTEQIFTTIYEQDKDFFKDK